MMTINAQNRSIEFKETLFGESVNDKHSKLNLTQITNRIEARNLNDLRGAVGFASRKLMQISVAGGRHSMGGQQFLKDGLLVDTAALKKILAFDRELGLIEVEAGITWTDLINDLKEIQKGTSKAWTIAQKQTGCDSLSIGGSLASNIHGRGLKMAPLVENVERFKIVLATGEVLCCDRENNRELFGLAIGGYGLFGLIASVTLRLVPLCTLERSVELIKAQDLLSRVDYFIANGATFGDFQFAIDSQSSDFLNLGVLSTYKKTDSPFVASNQKALSDDQWKELVYEAHADKRRAFELFSKHYLGTNGQRYRSDVFQLATYTENYHDSLDQKLPIEHQGSEVITELYVPRTSLTDFLTSAAVLLREQKASVIYGTVRFIEKDTETFLPWATEAWACVVLNLHTAHSAPELAQTRRCFCELIELARKFGGTYYLTYHKWATAEQILGCYPRLPDFFEKKLSYDPDELFCSNWYRHYRHLVGAGSMVNKERG